MSELFKVVLTRKIKKLGHIGDEVIVRLGYGRYLIQNQMAVSYDHSLCLNLKKEQKIQEISVEQMEKIYNTINNYVINFIRKSSTQGMLHGSVSRQDIYDAICNQLSIDKNHFHMKQLEVLERFKRVGVYTMNINIYDNLLAIITIVIGNNIDECNSLFKIYNGKIEVKE